VNTGFMGKSLAPTIALFVGRFARELLITAHFNDLSGINPVVRLKIVFGGL
jgi:hypothetical protein